MTENTQDWFLPHESETPQFSLPYPCYHLIANTQEDLGRDDPAVTEGPADNSMQLKSGFQLSTSVLLLYSFCLGFITCVKMELQLSLPKLSWETQAATVK